MIQCRGLNHFNRVLGVYYTITTTRNPQNPILIIKALTLLLDGPFLTSLEAGEMWRSGLNGFLSRDSKTP